MHGRYAIVVSVLALFRTLSSMLPQGALNASAALAGYLTHGIGDRMHAPRVGRRGRAELMVVAAASPWGLE